MTSHLIASAVSLVGLLLLSLFTPMPLSSLVILFALWTTFLTISQYSHNYRRSDYIAGCRGVYAAIGVLFLCFHLGFGVYLGLETTWWTPAAMFAAALAGSFLVTRFTDAVAFAVGGPTYIRALNSALGAPALVWNGVLAIIMFAIAKSAGS